MQIIAARGQAALGLVVLVLSCGDSGPGPDSCSDRTTLAVGSATASVYERKIATVVVDYLDCNGDPATWTLTYSSADSSIAILGSAGIIGVSPGQTQVTISDGTRNASITVTVKDLPEVIATLPIAGAPFGIAASMTTILATRLNSAAIADAPVPPVAFNQTGFSTGVYPTDVAIAGTGPKAYVTNQGPHEVGVLDMTTRTQTTVIPVGGSPFRVIFNALGTRAYVTIAESKVYVIDVATDSIIDSVAVGNAPNGLTLSPDEQTLFVSHMFGSVHLINTATNTPVDTLPITGQLQDVAVSFDGHTLYIASEFVGLVVWDLVTQSPVTTVTIPNAFGLKLHPAGDLIFVAGGSTVSILERATLTIVDTITRGGQFRRIAFTPIGSMGFVANEGASDVLVLE